MFRVPLILFAIAIFATGCTATGVQMTVNDFPSISPQMVPQVASMLQTSIDVHEARVRILGPPVFDALGSPPLGYTVSAAIDSERPGTGDEFQITLIGLFSKRVYLKDVMTEGRKLDAKVHDRERVYCGEGCNVAETLYVSISAQDLENWSRTGLTFKVIGRRVDFVASIPSVYFAAVRDKYHAALVRVRAGEADDLMRSNATPVGSQPGAPRSSLAE
jgi:hypothetical protein